MFRLPADSRDVQLADLLCDHSLKVQPGEMVVVQCSGLDGLPLAGACLEACARRGAAAFLHLVEPQVFRRFLSAADDGVLKRLAQFELKQMKDADCFIGIRGPANSFELSDVPQERMQAYSRLIVKPVHMEERLKRTRWVVMRYPNPAMSQMAQQSTEGFAEFYYRVCLLDYPRMAKAAEALKKAMEATDRVRLTAPGTDLSFSIKSIPAIPCCGSCNIPDGEVFTAPVKTSVEGVVQFNTPTLYDGFGFENIRLVFQKGKVVEATGSTPEQTRRLNEILDRDSGGRYLGEFAIGFHPHILHAMRDILFDEKIAGSFHMALGNSYDEAFNGNKSAIHWDLVCIQRPECGGGTIEFDGKVIRKDGRFVVKALEGLNPENLSEAPAKGSGKKGTAKPKNAAPAPNKAK
jgi:aminopeptidase